MRNETLTNYSIFISFVSNFFFYWKKYNSIYVANAACQKWADKGEFYTIETAAKTLEIYGKKKILYPSLKYKVPFRSSKQENETKQFVGIEIVNRKAKAVYTTPDHMKKSCVGNIYFI